EQTAALAALPDLSRPAHRTGHATGTNGRVDASNDLADCLALSKRFQAPSVDCGGLRAEDSSGREVPENKGNPCFSSEKVEHARRDSNPQPMVPKTIALSS